MRPYVAKVIRTNVSSPPTLGAFLQLLADRLSETTAASHPGNCRCILARHQLYECGRLSSHARDRGETSPIAMDAAKRALQGAWPKKGSWSARKFPCDATCAFTVRPPRSIQTFRVAVA